MNFRTLLFGALMLGAIHPGGAAAVSAPDAPALVDRTAAVEHVVVADLPGKFLAWPANEGIWSWGDEILVGFNVGSYRLNANGHSVDGKQPINDAFARSLDGGKNWTYEAAAYEQIQKNDQGLEFVPEKMSAQTAKNGWNLTDPDLILKFRINRFYVSPDRGRSWEGPYQLRIQGMEKPLRARTDYLVDSAQRLKIFLPTMKSDQTSGRSLMAESNDGGRSFQFISYLSPEPRIYENPKQSAHSFSIMPSTVRLDDQRLVTALRCRDGKKKWIEIRESVDDGRTWSLLATPSLMAWNPPSLIRLRDNRLCLTYADRCKPYSLRARLSSDGGRTWGAVQLLRQDADSWDIGYVRSVQRPDGKVVTVYYHRTPAQPEQFIAATIWQP